MLYCIGQKVDWRQLLTGTAVTFNPNGTAQVDPVTYQTAEPASSPAATPSPARSSPLTPLPPVRRAPSPCTGSSRRPPLTIGRNRRQFVELDKENALIPVGFDNTPPPADRV